jgi:hypothetical protein
MPILWLSGKPCYFNEPRNRQPLVVKIIDSVLEIASILAAGILIAMVLKMWSVK